MEHEEKKIAIQKRLELTDRELDRLVSSDKTGSKIDYLYARLDSLPRKNWSCTQTFWHTPQEYFDICCEVSDLTQVQIQKESFDAAAFYCPTIPENYAVC